MEDTFPTNLPLQLTSFIGREREITDVKRLLSTTRLLMLTGSGGCGKTRLALRVAGDLLNEYPDGVWFVDLAPLSDPALVPQVIASTFDLQESTQAPFMEVIHNYLHSKNLLLVLDNCEHLIQACAELSDAMLRACPNLKILATSREALSIAGETAFRVPSLSLPDPQALPSTKTLAQYESIRLFVERARDARTDFQLTDANAPAVAQICQRLDGMPLAIELAAARVRSISIEQIATRLDDIFRLLNAGSRTAPTRQQTLRETMEWSYALLSNDERTVLNRLSVFAGGWSLEAAESVCVDNKIHTPNIIDLLAHLVDKSLIVVEKEGARYRMLETIRQYALDKLQESGEAEQVRSHHLDFFLAFAEEAKSGLRSAEQLKWLNQQRSEYENMRSAIKWAFEDPSRLSSNKEMGFRLISAAEHLGDVYSLLGVGTQAVSFYQDAIALCTSLANTNNMLALRLHGKIVETARNLHWNIDLDHFEAMKQIGLASLATLRAELKLESLVPHPEIVGLLTILSQAIWRYQVSPEWDAVERYARAAVDMAEELDLPIELSAALLALSEVYFARGLLRERVEVALRRLALTSDPRFDDALQRVSALKDMGYALETVGEYALALPHLQEGINLAEQIQAVYEHRSLLQHFTFCLFRLDRWDEILQILVQVREMQKHYPREQAGPECFPIALAASVHARRGDIDLGAAERTEAHAIMTSLGGPLERWGRAQIH